jgi:uncharacterized protein YlaI
MKVQCVICEKIEEIDTDSYLGKKLRNHPLKTYMCKSCHQRIAENTEKKRNEGKLKESTFHIQDDDW